MRTMYNAACSCVLYPRGRPWLVGFWKQESVSFRREGLCAGRGVHPAAQAEPNQNGGRVCSAKHHACRHAILASAGRLGSPPARRAADRFLHRPHPGGSRVAINALSGRRGWGPPRRAGRDRRAGSRCSRCTPLAYRVSMRGRFLQCSNINRNFPMQGRIVKTARVALGSILRAKGPLEEPVSSVVAASHHKRNVDGDGGDGEEE